MQSCTDFSFFLAGGGGGAPGRISTDDSLVLNFGKEVEYTL